MNIKNLILLVLVGLQVFYSVQLRASDRLLVRMNENAFPASIKTVDGWQGMDVDLLNEMMTVTDLDYKIVSMPFKRAMAEITKGQLDLIVNLTKNSERSKDMHWIGPVRITKTAFVVLRKNQGAVINDLQQLIKIVKSNHQQIGHVIGVSYSPFLDDNFDNNANFNKHVWKSATRGQIVEMLRKDRIFGFFQDEFEASSRITAHKDDLTHPYSEFVIRESNIDNSQSGAYFGVSKHLDQASIDKLNQAFYQLQQDGHLQEIYEKWAGKVTVTVP